jgi:hypothetical protein
VTAEAEFALARELYAAVAEAFLDVVARPAGPLPHYLIVRDGRVVRLRWEVLPDHG